MKGSYDSNNSGVFASAHGSASGRAPVGAPGAPDVTPHDAPNGSVIATSKHMDFHPLKISAMMPSVSINTTTLPQDKNSVQSITLQHSHTRGAVEEDYVSSLHINELPDPILLSIFSFFPLSHRLYRAAFVCKYWHSLTCDPFLWHLCKFERQHRLNDVILERVVRYSSNVKTLEVGDCPAVTDLGLLAALNQCRALRKLSTAT